MIIIYNIVILNPVNFDHVEIFASRKKRMEAASNSNAAEKKRLEKQKADTMRKVGNIIDFIEGGEADETIIELSSEYVLAYDDK